MLMAYPYAKLLEFSEAGIQEVSYKDTEHYQLTRRFLEQPERYLSICWRNEVKSGDGAASHKQGLLPLFLPIDILIDMPTVNVFFTPFHHFHTQCLQPLNKPLLATR